jgi:uncharacterized protein YjbJ (UPF0337 family)
MPDFDELKGRAKTAAGEITDNDELKREGKIDKAKGKVDEFLDKATDKVKEVVDNKR